MIETARVDNIIRPGSAEERLNAVYLPEAPPHVTKFFQFMQTHITLASNGMGVGLRENKNDIAQLMKKLGYDYAIYQNFVEDFESKLLKQHYDEQDKK